MFQGHQSGSMIHMVMQDQLLQQSGMIVKIFQTSFKL